MPAMRSRAATMSARVGAVLINLEHLLHDVANCGQRVELPAADGIQETLELRVVLHRDLEVALGPGGRDGEHLATEVAAATRGQSAALLQVGAVLLDRRPQLVDALA